MPVLVTGVAGFIGSHVARALLARGETVVGIDNFSDYYDPVLKFARLKPLREDRAFTFLEADIADRDAMLALPGRHPGLDRIVHLAASPACGIRWLTLMSTSRPTSWATWSCSSSPGAAKG